jgi:hypothetical protein
MLPKTHIYPGLPTWDKLGEVLLVIADDESFIIPY